MELIQIGYKYLSLYQEKKRREKRTQKPDAQVRVKAGLKLMLVP